MTCVVGLKDADGVWLGVDSCVSNGNLILPQRSGEKLFKKGPFVFAISGNVRGENILRHSISIPKRKDKEAANHYLYNTVIDAVREGFKKAGFARKQNDKEEHGNTFLFVYESRLFKFASDYCLIELGDYHAEGSGRQYALGSLYTTAKLGLSPKERVRLALDASATFDAFVKPPHVIKCVKG